MHLKIPHKFGRSAAIARVQDAVAEARSKMGDKLTIEEERWEGDTLNFAFTAQGQHITGTLQVEDKEFVLDAKLPLMLRFFEKRIEREIAEQVKNTL